MFVINTTCPVCGKTTPVQIRRAADYHAWQNGTHAQDAFPYLSANEREALVSGICPTCRDNLFPPEEDEDEEEYFEPGRPVIDIIASNP